MPLGRKREQPCASLRLQMQRLLWWQSEDVTVALCGLLKQTEHKQLTLSVSSDSYFSPLCNFFLTPSRRLYNV